MKIIVSGLPGCGSTTLSLILAKSLNLKLYRGSASHRFFLEKLNIPQTGEGVIAMETLIQPFWGPIYDRFAKDIFLDNTEDNILLIMYFIIAMVNGVLTYKIRQIDKAASLKEERANSVKLYNTILNSLSHELRTPLATIIGATDNLQSNIHLTEENKSQLLSEISNASLRLNQQVENLLNISRLESGHIKAKNDWCDIVELVYDVVRRVEENNTRRKINISVNEYLPLCSIDKGMLDQVLYNLLNNAALHTDPSCSISISVSCHADLLDISIEDN